MRGGEGCQYGCMVGSGSNYGVCGLVQSGLNRGVVSLEGFDQVGLLKGGCGRGKWGGHPGGVRLP